MRLSKAVEKQLEALKKSPTFAMSLGAKELFHTNLLAFLLEASELDELQTKLREALGLPVEENELHRCAVWREKNNLDLIVVPLMKAIDADDPENVLPVQNRVLVIEAKLKSIPTAEQLKEYLAKKIVLSYPEETKNKTVRFTVGSDFVTRRLLAPGVAQIHKEWGNVSWETLANKIAGAALTTGPLQTILEDYANSLKNVVAVAETVTREVGNRWDLRLKTVKTTYEEFCEELGHRDFRKLRLHDLVGKIGFDKLLSHILGELQKEHELKPDKSYVFFSNGQPGITLEIDVGDGIRLGLQMQGQHMRHFISSDEPNGKLEIFATCGFIWNEWLNFKKERLELRGRSNEALRIFQTAKEGRLTNLFVFDSRRFLYSAASLKGKTLEDVACVIAESLRQAHKVKKQFLTSPLVP